MALYFSTKGVDVSGFGEGIARGLEKAAEQKRYERKLLSEEFKEFSRTFNPSKINNSEDSKAFIDAAYQWKELKKQALKEEQGSLFKRGNIEKVNQIEAKAQEALNKAIGTYQDRVEVNGVIKKTEDQLKYYRNKGIIAPMALINQANYLRSTAVSNIDKDSIVDPGAIPVKSDLKDLTEYRKGLKGISSTAAPKEELTGESFKAGVGVIGENKQGLTISKKRIYQEADPIQARQYTLSIAKGRTLENDATEAWDELQRRLQSVDPIIRASAQDEVQKVSIKAQADPSQLDKFDYFTYVNGGYDKSYGKSVKYDKDELMAAFKTASALSADERNKLAKENNDFGKMLRFMSFIKDPKTQAVLMKYTPGERGAEGTFKINENVPPEMQSMLRQIGFGSTEELSSMYEGIQDVMGKSWGDALRNIITGSEQSKNPAASVSTSNVPTKK